MAGGFVNIDIKDDNERLRRVLQALERRTGNLAPAFADVGEYLQLAHDQRFRDQKSPAGDSWAALSETYRKRKKRNKDRVLVLDDILAGSLHYLAAPARLAFGTDRIHGATHQFGDADRNIPARPFIGLSAADELEALRLVEKHLLAAAR